MKIVKLINDVQYPALWPCDLKGLIYKAGETVPVIPATNQPDWEEKGLFFIDTPELKNDCYGILISKEDYEITHYEIGNNER